jgi:transglutaminase-like putative cysteine protease
VSRLEANESGRVTSVLGEEINGRRHARLRLNLDASPATLYLLARPHSETSPELTVQLGDRRVATLEPSVAPALRWYEVELPRGADDSDGTVTLSSTGAAMDGWSLGVDYSAGGGDHLSTDGGRSWSSERIGYLHLAAGRYVVRARTQQGQDPDPPDHSWEDTDHPVVGEFRDALPAGLTSGSSTWDVVRRLSTWVCRSWAYRNASDAQQYAPWDAPTILTWGAAQRGHGGRVPIAMCVHYAIVLATACQALGIPARCAVLTGSINGYDGHFVNEVWIEEWHRWVMIDPTFDAFVQTPDGPAGLRAIRELGPEIGAYLKSGPGIEDRLRTESGKTWFEQNFLRGICFRNRSVWPRSDFLTRPQLSPPGHGESSYSELDLVWEQRSRDNGFGMFRYFAGDEWFDASPLPTTQHSNHQRKNT